MTARCVPFGITAQALQVAKRPIVRRPRDANRVCARGLQALGGVQVRGIHDQSPPPPTTRPKRPSPYRLLQPHTFLADFGPLHVAGWRLDVLPSPGSSSSSKQPANALKMDEGMEDLQGRRLIRTYRFSEGKEGFRDLMGLVGDIGKVIEEEDHHPVLLISPASDYTADTTESPSGGYVLEVATHTHTPMPPLRSTIPSIGESPPPKSEKMRPGVTRKDTKLAERLEEAYRNRTAGVPV